MKKAARNKKKSFFEASPVQDVAEVIGQAKDEIMINPVKKILSKKLTKLVIAIIIILVIVGGGLYQAQKLNNATSENGKLTPSAVNDLIAEVGDKMMLPKGETPTIATVTDVTKLEGQPFYRNAQNGDLLIVIGSTKQVLLYRRSIHKIINFAILNTNANSTNTPASQSAQIAPGASSTPTPTKAEEKLKVVVLNSTKTVGLAKKGADLLDKTKVEVLSTANAQGEYDKTTVSSVNKDKKITDSQLKDLVSVFSKIKPSVSALPTGEAAPAGVDVVIIFGSDFAASY